MKKLTIILDPAHGQNVPGKQSPDGKHHEYLWSRLICDKLQELLVNEGYSCFLTTTSDDEPGLTFRQHKASEVPFENKLLISLHNNAAGMGVKWMDARGVEIWTSPGQTKSDEYATIILEELEETFPSLKFRKDISDGDVDKESKFTVLMGNGYSAVLLEWLFQDNIEDVNLLMDEDVNYELCNALIRSINEIEETL
jgi:N-acetylmuramoyl-L-alanine amidase